MNKREQINLYVDDIRECPQGFVVARTSNDAKKMFEKYDINILSLDHDLGCDSKGSLADTGYDLVKWFCENGMYANSIYLHTDNPVGRENMYQTLLGAQRRGFISDSIKIYNGRML